MIGWVSPAVAALGRRTGGNSVIHRNPVCMTRGGTGLVPVRTDAEGRISDAPPLPWCERCTPPEVPGPWALKGACRGSDPDVFFRDGKMGGRMWDQARRICAQCVVLDDCREYALRVQPEYGFWAGMTVDERREAVSA